MVACSWLLFLISLASFATSAPTTISDRGVIDDLGKLASDEADALNTLVKTGIQTLTELLDALSTGQIEQNGLEGIVNTTGANATATNVNGTVTKAATACPDIAVLFARGTTEPGNMGFLTGPPFTTALQNYANGSSIAIQGIDYPADVAGFKAGGSSLGATTMADLTNATMAACPSAKVVLSGYSQGAQVVRKACTMLGAATAAGLNSVVMFGDPGNGTSVPGVDAARVFTACHAGDNICKGGSLVLPPHLNYSSDAPAAAMFVMQKTGLGMGSADAVMQGMADIPMMSATAAAASSSSADQGLGGATTVMDLASSDAAKNGAKKGIMGMLGLGA
jgi:cutinase